MAKVGRAAYAASRARLEVVTADKTISKNESGELYAVDAAAALAITLPSDAESGTRYKFMIIDDVGSGAITITGPYPNFSITGTTYTAGTGLTLSGTEFSIDSTYAGQASITTLGTVTTGTINGGTF